MSLTLAEKLQKSALNIEESSETKKRTMSNSQNLKSEDIKLSNKKILLNNEFRSKESELEIQRLKKELQLQKDAYRKLEVTKVVKKSFKNYKAKTYRITHQQEEMLRDLWKSLPDDVDRLESITSNSFLRAILENILERRDLIDLKGISTESDVYTEIKRLFK